MEEKREAERESEKEREEDAGEEKVYRTLWSLGLAKGQQIGVIGHRNPDPDSVGAAMALSFLLENLGYISESLTAGEISSETRFALHFLGLSAPRMIQEADGGTYYLVDHSSYAQAISGMEEGQVVGILDHHALGDVVSLKGVKITCAPVGASCSLVYLAYKQCRIPIREDMARAMLMGILSDTRNLTRNVEAIDEKAAGELLLLSGLSLEETHELYRGMARSSASYEGKSDLEIFESRYKVYSLGKVMVGIGDVNVLGEKEMLPMAERMKKVMKQMRDSLPVDILFTMVTDKEEKNGEMGTFRMGMVTEEEETKKLLGKAFPEAIEKEGILWFPRSLSRKTAILPALLKTIG